MNNDFKTSRLPFSMPQPAAPKKRQLAQIGRVAAYIAFAATLIAPIVQLEHKILKNHHKAMKYEQKLQAGTLSEKELLAGPPKPHKGAINRWRSAICGLWAGVDIYQTPDELGRKRMEAARALSEKPGSPKPHKGVIRRWWLAIRGFWSGEDICQTSDEVDRKRMEADGDLPDEELVALHPNMPFTVIVLTPFVLLPIGVGGLVFTICKAIVVLLAVLAAVQVANHTSLRMPDWVVGLGILWWFLLMISDIQHANTNLFVMGFIVFHLWLYRRGNDLLSGASLAVAICLKMTPALFVLYWLYQRNWKLLLGCLTAGILFAVVIPAAMLGSNHYVDLMHSWTENLIFKGLGGAWYPIHVNQSLPATIGRYLLGGHPGGDVEWNPDDNPYHLQTTHQWIAFASLSPATVKHIIQAMQMLIVLGAAWAIGWRKLPRNDGRRGLHYAMVLCGILLLNQRTWDHHAAILLPATLAIWYAIAFGRLHRRVRLAAIILMLLAGVLLWGSAGDLTVLYGRWAGMSKPDAKLFADRFLAYGPKCGYFLLLMFTAMLLTAAMKKSDPPYSEQRQTLGKTG